MIRSSLRWRASGQTRSTLRRSRTCCWLVAASPRRVTRRTADFIYRGIANRSFERRFALADHIQVTGADLKDGLLSIELVREIPEAMKPRKIDIGGSSEKLASQRTIDAEAEQA